MGSWQSTDGKLESKSAHTKKNYTWFWNLEEQNTETLKESTSSLDRQSLPTFQTVSYTQISVNYSHRQVKEALPYSRDLPRISQLNATGLRFPATLDTLGPRFLHFLHLWLREHRRRGGWKTLSTWIPGSLLWNNLSEKWMHKLNNTNSSIKMLVWKEGNFPGV